MMSSSHLIPPVYNLSRFERISIMLILQCMGEKDEYRYGQDDREKGVYKMKMMRKSTD